MSRRTAVYVGERCDVVERERRQFDEQLDAQQGVIDDILRRNDGDSQNMAVDDELDLQQERAKLHQMQQVRIKGTNSWTGLLASVLVNCATQQTSTRSDFSALEVVRGLC